MATLKAPFPYYGGKSTVSQYVWKRFGSVAQYIEPFCGSASVLLQRPDIRGMEIINDIDGFVVNFWRAVKSDPVAVAEWADWPVTEVDLYARNGYLIAMSETLPEQLKADPHWYDAKAAGWWVWGMCLWTGQGWGRKAYNKRPELMARKGITAIQDKVGAMQRLCERLAKVQVICGDWQRAVAESLIGRTDVPTAIFLDPPYSHAEREVGLYRIDEDVSAVVRQWAIDNGNRKHLRIALCGYQGEHDMPPSWSVYEWVAHGSHNLTSRHDAKSNRGNENRKRERIWFSPHCLSADQLSFGDYLPDTVTELRS